ncbi:hypothetical protein QBC32DRAFT_317367 [Pseudoneurospora amorphoporcata]|uniref:Uncharacterized protein n=1 Tax=Pseudoneurospora amorphoporcata TaxID=241081 RepID=A0AAN6SDE0_9PEZI|nr:hypothetical protein QBC32DRAFT_317367 [Pseudoneurospora amorphoporcata]
MAIDETDTPIEEAVNLSSTAANALSSIPINDFLVPRESTPPDDLPKENESIPINPTLLESQAVDSQAVDS